MALLTLNLVCLLLPLAGMAVAFLSWRATREEKPGGTASMLEMGEGRTRFLALCGLLGSALFVLATLFDSAMIIGVPTCWEMGG
jgi:hypothetical protein